MKLRDVQELIALRDRDQASVLSATGCSGDDIDSGYGYQSMEDLAVVRPSRLDGVRIYFDNEKLVMIAVSEPSISADDLLSMMGDHMVELRSRQGKRAMIWPDSEAGLAFSADDDEVGFLEIFPSTTDDDYRDRIYKEPPPFRK